MSYAIIVLNACALAGLVLAAWFGYGVSAAVAEAASREAVGAAFRPHLFFALGSTIVAIFAQSMTFFYFIGTGKSIKVAVAEYGLDSAHVDQTRDFKRRTSPAALWALLAVMAAFVLGGGAATRAVPAGVHHVVALAAILLQGYATLVGAQVIRTNMELLDRLDREVGALAARGATDVKRLSV